MKTLVLLVEDDVLTTKLIEKNLENYPEAQLVGKAGSLQEAISFLEEHRPNLVFLDVELPDGRGFDLIPHLTNTPKIVVLTGNENYAFTAFENGAVDFLKKPVTPSRFKTCMEKINAFGNAVAPAAEKPSLFVKSGYKQIRVNIEELLYAEAVGDYVKLFLTEKKPLLINISLKELTARLQHHAFLQVHRSFLVNINLIDTIDEEGIAFGETLIPVGKTYKASLQKMLK